MKLDEEGKKKIEKTEERITHKIAKDLEKAESKRKAEGEAHREGPDHLAGEECQPRDEENAKRRKQEDADHRNAASSSSPATMDVDSGAAHGSVAVDKEGETQEEGKQDRRGEKRRAEEELDRDEDQGIDIDAIEEKEKKRTQKVSQ